MAHSQETAEAVGAPSLNEADAAAALRKMFGEAPEGDVAGDVPEAEPEAADADEPDADDYDAPGDDDSDEEGEEPDAPAIPAPASLTADEKAAFAQLPVEAQRLLADVETRRNTQVQQATTKAADAQRAAEAAAADAVMKAQADQAERYRQFVAAYAPKAPDIGLLQSNPALYLAQKAQHDAETAHHNQLVEQIDAMAAQAEKHFEAQQQAWGAEQRRLLMAVPEYADPAKRGAFIEGLEALARELNFPDDALANAGATDILALKTAAGWKAKAEKYDAAQSRKMQRVRDAKSTKPGVPSAPQAGRVRQHKQTMDRLRTSGSLDDAAAAFRSILS